MAAVTRRRNHKAAREQRHRHREYVACETCRAYCGPGHDVREWWCSAECFMAWYADDLGLLTADDEEI